MKLKEIEIKTIEDIIKKVPRNRLEYFLKDLTSYIDFKIEMYKWLESYWLQDIEMESSMKWIDDWKNDFKWMNISVK